MEILLGVPAFVGVRLALVSDAFAVEGGVLAALTLIIACVVSIGRVPRAAYLCDAATLPSLVAVHALASSASAAPWLRLQLRCSLCCWHMFVCTLMVFALIVSTQIFCTQINTFDKAK